MKWITSATIEISPVLGAKTACIEDAVIPPTWKQYERVDRTQLEQMLLEDEGLSRLNVPKGILTMKKIQYGWNVGGTGNADAKPVSIQIIGLELLGVGKGHKTMVAQYLFPEDRAAYITGEPLDPLRHGGGMQVVLYTDMTCITPADIYSYPDQDPILDSIIVVAEDSLLPLFYADLDELVARPVGGSPYVLFSRLDGRVEALEQVIPGSEGPIGPTGPMGPQGIPGTPGIPGVGTTDYVMYVQSIAEASWVIPHAFAYTPDVEVFTPSGERIYADESSPAPNVLQIDFAFPMTGYARLS